MSDCDVFSALAIILNLSSNLRNVILLFHLPLFLFLCSAVSQFCYCCSSSSFYPVFYLSTAFACNVRLMTQTSAHHRLTTSLENIVLQENRREKRTFLPAFLITICSRQWYSEYGLINTIYIYHCYFSYQNIQATSA